jgi:hypothetical protein
MTEQFAYTYSVLRYRHDPLAGEQVNVGVILHCPKGRFCQFRMRHTFGRFRDLFPDLDGDAFKASLKAIERSVERVASHGGDGLFAGLENALAVGQRALPQDDSSFVWGALGSGLTSDPRAQLESLFERFVSLYDAQRKHVRGDADIWRPVRDMLDERHLVDRLQKKAIHSSIDTVVFEHAWKNSTWHCYEPVSFDLANEDSIREKARRWVGHLTTVRESTEPFKPHFIVGRPAAPELAAAYKAAIKMLEKSPIPSEVIEEDRIGYLVDKIEDEIRRHDGKLG